jgi:hypothetical protein
VKIDFGRVSAASPRPLRGGNRWRQTGPCLTALAIAGLIVVSLVGWSLPASSETMAPTLVRQINLNGDRVLMSSVSLGDLNGDGVSDIVVGGRDGKLHAYTGAGARLWEFDTGAMGIDGKAAIGDIDRDGHNEVVVGAGSTSTPAANGALYVLRDNGALKCSLQSRDFNNNGYSEGVYSSPALSDIDQNDGGRLEIVYGAWDGYVRVLNDDCGLIWEHYVRDTIWSSPAIGDIDADGQLEIVIGVDSHDEPILGTAPGGMLHVFRADGSEQFGFPVQIDETFFSSPALGDINGDGWLDIVIGTGNCWSNPACAPGGQATAGVGQYLNAWGRFGRPLPGWPKPVPGTHAISSPALADMDGDGQLEVIINTADARIHVLNGDGSYVPGWPTYPVTPTGVGTTSVAYTDASPVIADLTGDGLPEVILPSNWEVAVFDRSGHQLTRNSFPVAPGAWSLDAPYQVLGTVGIGDVDGDGHLEIVVGTSTSNGLTGAVQVWRAGASSATGAIWPVFRRDAPNWARVPLVGRPSSALAVGEPVAYQTMPTPVPADTTVATGPAAAQATPVARAYLSIVAAVPPTPTATATPVDSRDWCNGTAMQSDRAFAAYTTFNGKIYAIGGMNQSGETASVAQFDPGSGGWTGRSPMWIPRYYLGAAGAGDKIYAIGGIGPGGALTVVEEFNPAFNVWMVLSGSPMPTPRFALGVAAVGTRMFAVGGSNANGLLSTVEVLDYSNLRWTGAAPMSVPRAGHAVVEANGRIYAIGGTTAGGIVATVEEYDPGSNTWRSRASMATPRTNAAIANVGGLVYVMGGRGPTGALTSVEVYNPLTNAWSSAKALPVGRVGAIGAAYGSDPMISGGFSPLAGGFNPWTGYLH